jgi:AcrR family transcriptional regulator
MATDIQAKTARDRILNTAADLFYRNGYRATGINEVIAKAEVAKATFYAHFPTKDDLCLAYLKDRNSREAGEIMDFVNSKRTPLTRFYAVMDSMTAQKRVKGVRLEFTKSMISAASRELRSFK